jgi:YHS domain-containing protein
MKLFDLLFKKKGKELSDIPIEKPAQEPEAKPVDIAKANLPVCRICGEMIHEKPRYMYAGHEKYPFHKRCYRKFRKNPTKYEEK